MEKDFGAVPCICLIIILIFLFVYKYKIRYRFIIDKVDKKISSKVY